MGQQIGTRPSTGKSEDGAAWASTERASKKVSADDVQGTPRTLLLRVDLLLVPLLFVAYGLQFWDKAVLGSATLFNLIPSLGLGGTKYGTSSGAFYWGYLVGAFPMSLAANHFKRINVWLGSCIVVWGGILLLTPAIQNFGGLVAQRFFLGFVESSVSPGFVAVTRRWYTREEQTVRLGLWYSATGVFSIVSGLTNYGLGHTRTSLPQSWMILFLVPGAFTIALGVLFALLLPPSPDTQPILAIPGYNSFSEGQRELLSKRLEPEKGDPLRNCAGELDWKDDWSVREIRRAARDPKMWLFLAIATLIYVVNGSVTVFGPILVRAVFRSGGAEALALQAPGGAVTAISIYLVIFISRRYQGTRLLLLILSCLPVIAGALMIWLSDWTDRAVPYAGYLLLPIFGAPFVMLLGIASSEIRGKTQQAIATGSIFTGYCAGNIASGYILVNDPSQARQNYEKTWKIVIGVMAGTVAAALLLGAVLPGEVRRDNIATVQSGVREQTEQKQEEVDATNPSSAGRSTSRGHRHRGLWRFFLITILLGVVQSRDVEEKGAYAEHLSIRPLIDGRVHTHFSFNVREADLESQVYKDIWSTNHYNLLPRALMHTAQAGRAEEIALSINRGTWDYGKWGHPMHVHGDVGMVGSGAELWARLRGMSNETTESAAQPSEQIMVGWKRLTASLAGLFCTTLNALDTRTTVSPSHLPIVSPLIHSRTQSSSPGHPTSSDGQRSTKLLHSFLPSENICTENLSPLLGLLPCAAHAGLASLLEPHAVAAADFSGMTVRLARDEHWGGQDGKGAWQLNIAVNVVFSPHTGLFEGRRNWSLTKLFSRSLQRSCPLASSSTLHVHRPADAPVELNEDGDVAPPAFVVEPMPLGPVTASGQDDQEETKSEAKEAYMRGEKLEYDLNALDMPFELEMRWRDETSFAHPHNVPLPELSVSRSFVGAGQERGRVQLTLRNIDPKRERNVLYYDVLPWFVRPYLHSLNTTLELDEWDESASDIVRFADEETLNPLLSLSYSAASTRERPSRIEAFLRVPPASTLLLTYDYDKAFMRYEEHPPDAHRGFDLPPAVIVERVRNPNDGNEVWGRRWYTAPALLEVAVPDFSMPYNVIIFSSTLVALGAGSALNNLVRKYSDSVSVR